MRSPTPAIDLRAALSEELSAALAEIEDGRAKPKAVHRCRVRVKRARALARIGHAGAPGLSAVFVDSTRALMRVLGQARDPAALTEAARKAAREAKKKRGEALAALADTLEAERRASNGLNIEAARSGLKDLLALAQVWPEASARQIRKGARRIDRRARKARRCGLASRDTMSRHTWRKREKDRLFASVLLGDAWPGKTRRRLAADLGDALGAERDAALLLARLRAEPELIGDKKPVKRAFKALRRRRKRLARKADKLGAHLAERT